MIVLPAYNAALTLKKTYQEIPFDIVDEVILVDDNSSDKTIEIATRSLASRISLSMIRTGAMAAIKKHVITKRLEIGGDIIIMLHPDYQYTPKLIPSMAYLIANNVYQVVLGSRTLGKGALHGGMPLYKYIANRALTFFENVMLNQKVAEYHTGYRAFSREVLERINYEINSEDFVFDNQMLSQIIYLGYEIAEITCPTRYFEEASSINLQRSITYGLGVLKVSIVHRLCKWGLMKRKMYKPMNILKLKNNS